MALWGFDYEWERVRGEYIFQVWHKDCKLGEKIFWVVEGFRALVNWPRPWVQTSTVIKK